MADSSEIEWTDATWNPVRGCTKVSPGCKHCYAEAFAERFRGVPGHAYEQGFDLRLAPELLTRPLYWARPRTIFVNSMSDLFHEGVPESYIDCVFAMMELADWHVYQVLTKRAGRMRQVLEQEDMPAHIWLGVSVEDRKYGLPRIEELRRTPAAVRFLSIEPLLEDIAGDLDLTGIDWVIVGGESGPDARPMHPDWVRRIRERCGAQGVPFFFKQWGAWLPISEMTEPEFDRLYEPAPEQDPERARRCRVQNFGIGFDGGKDHWRKVGGYPSYLTFRVGKKAAGRTLDGKLHGAMPPEVRGERPGLEELRRRKAEAARLVDEVTGTIAELEPDEMEAAIREEFTRQLTQPRRKCRRCGCTDYDSQQCIEAQGHPCWWVAEDLCSRCEGRE